MSGTSIHNSATFGSLFLYRRLMLDSFSCERRQHSRVLGRIFVEPFKRPEDNMYEWP